MRRETFVSLMSTIISEADDELLREAEGLVFWRKRELRAEKVQEYSPGLIIEYLAKDGRTRKQGTIAKLNKYSVTIRHAHPTEGYTPEVVMIERVVGLAVHTMDLSAAEQRVVGSLMRKTDAEIQLDNHLDRWE